MLAAALVLTTLILLQFKHLIIDWIWQPPYEWMNKGTYGHLGGIHHAGKNAIGTGLCVYLGFQGYASPLLCVWLAVLDFTVHYHIDWVKMNVNDLCGLKPDCARFWWALGADQFAHQITYIALVLYALVATL